jgi:hypothetical protein
MLPTGGAAKIDLAIAVCLDRPEGDAIECSNLWNCANRGRRYRNSILIRNATFNLPLSAILCLGVREQDRRNLGQM